MEQRQDQVARLRGVLRANAVVTGACGAAMLAAGGPLSDVLEVEWAVVTGIAAFFLVLAADVWFLSGRSPGAVVATGRLLAVADAGWALATVVVVAAGLLPVAGAVLALAVAAVTAGFAVAEHAAAAAARPAPALAA